MAIAQIVVKQLEHFGQSCVSSVIEIVAVGHVSVNVIEAAFWATLNQQTTTNVLLGQFVARVPQANVMVPPKYRNNAYKIHIEEFDEK